MILESRLCHFRAALCTFSLTLITLTAFNLMALQLLIWHLFLTILIYARDSKLVKQFDDVSVYRCEGRSFLEAFWADICGEQRP